MLSTNVNKIKEEFFLFSESCHKKFAVVQNKHALKTFCHVVLKIISLVQLFLPKFIN